jgi:DNA-binding HxlR family transcriptional regulator
MPDHLPRQAEDTMKKTLRSDCPIAASLDVLGDRWTMLILRDMLLGGKSQFGEFATNEGVATNILADRLATLVERGIIERVPDKADRRKYHYRVLRPGVELLPVIAELVVWGVTNTDVPPSAEFESMLDASTRATFVRERTKQLLTQI